MALPSMILGCSGIIRGPGCRSGYMPAKRHTPSPSCLSIVARRLAGASAWALGLGYDGQTMRIMVEPVSPRASWETANGLLAKKVARLVRTLDALQHFAGYGRPRHRDDCPRAGLSPGGYESECPCGFSQAFVEWRAVLKLE